MHVSLHIRYVHACVKGDAYTPHLSSYVFQVNMHSDVCCHIAVDASVQAVNRGRRAARLFGSAFLSCQTVRYR